MRFVLAAFAIGIAAGYLAGGRLSNLAHLRARFPWLAVIGLGLQVAPVPGRTLSLVLLDASFALLLVFAVVNVRRPGFALILIGIVLNLTVILANTGMPVTRQALVASHQQSTLSLLVHDGGAKHHLATGRDVLLPLGDVIGIGPLEQVVSPGDIVMYLGVIWLLVAGMRRRPRAAPAPPPTAREAVGVEG